MGAPAKRRATYEDVCAAPDNVVAELIHGQLVTGPRPAAPHARASSILGSELTGPFDRGKNGPGGWVIVDEPELHLAGHVLVPDLAGWRRPRMPEIPSTVAFEIVPDWICEVISPATAATDRADKMPVYSELGVEHLWLVDPLSCTLEVYRLESSRYMVLGTWRGESLVRADPFAAVELELGALWAR